jgi:solute carrier family 34 (sodium-dependent phosphate cotransporter)
MKLDRLRALHSRHGRPISPATLLRCLQVAILLYLFLTAINLLSGAFKLFGGGFSEALISGTSNPVMGLLIGLLATSLIQSSSSSSSIVVGLVAAGALTVRGAIPILMGANMGTTVTNTMVALTSRSRRGEFVRAFAGATMHDFFNLLTIIILFPLEQTTRFLENSATWLCDHLIGAQGLEFTSPVKVIVQPVERALTHVLLDLLHLPPWAVGTILLAVALALIFLALSGLTRTLRQVVLDRAEGSLAGWVGRGGIGAMIVGLVLTVSVQSSSITTSLMIPLVGAGIVPLAGAFAVTLGANMGTTITALLASLAGNAAAVTVALVHVLFNLTGILIIYPVPAIRRIPINMARTLAHRTAQRRVFALFYMVGVFFLLPLIFLVLERWISKGFD